jgi:peroxiredoxin
MDAKQCIVRSTRIVVLCVLFAFLLSGIALSAPQPGDVLPKIKLAKPAGADKLAYLGLSGHGSFSLADITAKIVIIEFYSLYCPYCQAEAPNTVKLYNDIQSDPALRQAIKVIGIGVGNSDYEVAVFRDKYGIPFPLFSDEEFATVKELGLQFTPHFIAVRIDGNGKAHVLYSQSGSIGDPREFLNKISHQ